MKKKSDFWDKTFLGYILKNIGIAIAAILGIALVALFLINIYTKHGKSEAVPNLKGLSIEEADAMLRKQKLKFEIIDSVFMRDKKLGTVIEQNPVANSIVKPGRKIYLIINSKAVRQVKFPNVTDISVRQAEAMIKSLRINIANIQYAPSAYRDLVLEAKYNGKTLTQGDKVPEGASIVLVVGDGYGGYDGISSGAPSLIGLDLYSATETINTSTFLIGYLTYDVEPNGDESSYVVYRQRPEPGEPIDAGSTIDLFLTKDRSKLEVPTSQVPVTNQHTTPVEKKEKKEKVKDIEEFF